jgi:plasmid stability protein
VRTTLTLDDDVAAKLKSRARRSGRPFRDVVNEVLRHGLLTGNGSRPRTRFVVEPRDLGELRPGLSLDNVAELLDSVEGSTHR